MGGTDDKLRLLLECNPTVVGEFLSQIPDSASDWRYNGAKAALRALDLSSNADVLRHSVRIFISTGKLPELEKFLLDNARDPQCTTNILFAMAAMPLAGEVVLVALENGLIDAPLGRYQVLCALFDNEVVAFGGRRHRLFKLAKDLARRPVSVWPTKLISEHASKRLRHMMKRLEAPGF